MNQILVTEKLYITPEIIAGDDFFAKDFRLL